jgi:cardiolipin synthase
MPEVDSATRDPVGELSMLVGSPAHAAGEVQILRDGEAAFDAMIELIAAARGRVNFENFIIAGDATGRRFADALMAAARRGVGVRVLYDPIGTLMVRGGSIARVLRGSGVDIRPFRPLSPYAPRTWMRLRHRDHRKTLSVDGRHAIVGGLCISDNWSPSSRGGNAWRDTALRVGGAVVRDLEQSFDAMWRDDNAADAADTPSASDDVAPPAVMVTADRPGAQCVGRLYSWLAERATTTIELTDAYLVVPARALEALVGAARRGVRVRLLLPGHNNHALAGAAARRNYEMLLEAGVEIWEWSGAMVHAKTVVVDGEISLVGSSNLDPLSLRRNYELNLLVVDPITGSGMRAMFERDLENAKRIDIDSWGRRPRWRQLAEAGARMFAPNL